MNASYDLSYSLRNENHDTVRNVRIDFENPTDEFLVEQLNTWLSVIGCETKPMRTSYEMAYTLLTEDHETVRNIRIDLENPSEEFLAEQVNVFLTAIGSEHRVGISPE